MNKTLRDAGRVAEIFGAKPGSSRAEKARALLSGLRLAGGTPRMIAKVEAQIKQMEAEDGR